MYGIERLSYLFGQGIPVPFPPGGAGGNLPPPPTDGNLDMWSSRASEILQQSLDLASNTSVSWDEVWDYTIFNLQNNYLWDNLVALGLKLALISVLYMALMEGPNFVKQQDYAALVELFVWPVIIMIFLTHNGYLLAKTIQITRTIALYEINQVYQTQIDGISLHDSLVEYQITSTALDAIDGSVKSCQGKSAQELEACLRRAATKVEKIYSDSETTAREVIPSKKGGLLAGLRKHVLPMMFSFNSSVNSAINLSQVPGVNRIVSHAFKSGYVQILKTVAYCVQWAFANGLEVALLLSALIAPLALGLSLLPIQGRPIVGWLIGYVTLWGVPLGYAIIVGLTSWVMVHSQLEALADLAFTLYLSLFASSLATSVMTLSGIAIHQGVINNIDAIKNVISEALSFTTGVALKIASR